MSGRYLVWEMNQLAMTPFNLLGIYDKREDADEHKDTADGYAANTGSGATHWVATEGESANYRYVERGNGPCGRAYRAWKQAWDRRKECKARG